MPAEQIIKKRIAYMDLAKGVCILLVLWFHLKSLYNIHSYADIYLNAVRMPLYFFLSGYFFKTYESFFVFVRRKIQNLLIPFIFFYTLTSVLLPIALHKFLGFSFNTGQDWQLVYAFLTYKDFPNIPLWFLWGLFILNVSFYALLRLTRHDIVLGLFCLIIGLALGYAWELPASLNNTFRGLPFFYMGYIFYQYDLLNRTNSKYTIPIILFVFIALGQTYSTSIPIGILLSATGVTLLILICKIIGHLPFVSYVGRYSIILLLTHEPIIRLLSMLHIDSPILAYIMLTLSYIGIIPFMRKYLPHVTAQKG